MRANKNRKNLRRYLSNVPQMLPFVPHYRAKGSNVRRNHRYQPRHIRGFEPWPDFNAETIVDKYKYEMRRFIVNDPFPDTPPLYIGNEYSISHRLWEYLGPRVRRSLRTGFKPPPMGHTPVLWNLGDLSPSMDLYGSSPDLTFYTTEPFTVGDVLFPPRHNRLPGEIKPSSKWNSGMAGGTAIELEYLQAVSQLNYYMHIHKARYGYILTDRELVAFERIPTKHYSMARFKRSNPISWIPTELHDIERTPTVLMALWYLGMLAAGPDWAIDTHDIPKPTAPRTIQLRGPRQ
ncbi:hypothetical protein VHEMI08157 [[Torrubiella] hemipterigena]|uniref:Uncharacterized protein n=1 Tax=[Torrubiella] hemipterigena TaxID=1531966 RepID=A0A0A1TP65_9HYPO|nr:hypothetical protein VHEMI08157 [[Torrubiella] hemipterigena]